MRFTSTTYSILLTIIVLLFSIQAKSEKYLSISDTFKLKTLSNEMSFLLDNNNEYSIADLNSPTLKNSFITISDTIPFLSFQSTSIWIRFTLKNESVDTKNIIIKYENPLINYITFYKNESPGSYKKQISGLSVPMVSKNSTDQFIYFETELYPDETKTYYLNLRNKGLDFSLPFVIYNDKTFFKNSLISNTWLGLMYGILVSVLLINLFFYINLQHKIYLYYILYIFSFGLFLLTRDGILNIFLWGNCIWCAEQGAFFFAELPIIFMLLFTQSALRTDFYLPKLNNLINVLIIIISAFTIASFVFETPLYIFCNISVGITFIPVFIVSFFSLKSKNLSLPRYFFAGIILISVGVGFMVVKNLGYINYTTGEIGLKLGFLGQLLMLSFGLTTMYRTILKETSKDAIENLKKLNKIKDQINIELEEKVISRTEELDKKNTELIIANKQLGAERDIFETQRNLIYQQRKETTDSIKYAQRIQRTLIPSAEKLSSKLSEYFIVEVPKDIVSGDFYWIEEFDDKTIICVADCTGHGVPGAFMSIIGITFLNEIVNFHNISKPNEILDMLRMKIITAFTRTHEGDIPKDGMDISLISIDKKLMKLEFAGAYNPLYIVRGNQLIAINADKMPISINEKQDIPFNNNVFDLKKDDFIYMFTDGFVDQFGWRSGKKFKNNQFKELLLDINDLPLEARKVIIYNTFKNWKGDLEQIDDILIMGLKP